MIALTLIIWLVNIFWSLYLYAIYVEKKLNITALPLSISVLVTFALYYDIYSSMPKNWDQFLNFLFIGGLIALGILSIFSMIYKFIFRSTNYSSSKFSGFFQTIFSFISLVSSILGIISFYFDHLKK